MLQCTFFVNAQIPRDTILYEENKKYSDNIPFYLVKDSVYYKWEWDKRKKTYSLFYDTILIPSIPHLSVQTYFYDKEFQRLYTGKHNGYKFNYSAYDLQQDTIRVLSTYNDTDVYQYAMTNNYFYYVKGQELYVWDLYSEKAIDSITISKEFNTSSFVISEIIKFSNSNKIFFMVADEYYGDERTKEQYYIYDFISKKLELCKNNDEIKSNINPMAFGINFYDLSGNHVFLREHILTSDFKIFSKCLYQQYTDIYGLVISKEEIKQIILHSKLDAGDLDVLIPFIPNPFREKALYEIYENMELKAEDLKQLDTFDLRLLRNMVFAKHNYAFKDKFLQAYFNLYGFYKANSDKNRLTDVSHLLTIEDKKNLELIEQAEEKMKKENK
jgi:hypothetical protein